MYFFLTVLFLALFFAFRALEIGFLASLSLACAIVCVFAGIALWACRGAKSAGKRMAGGLNKEWSAVEKSKAGHPDFAKKAVEYSRVLGQKAGEAGFLEPEQKYAIGDKPWERIGAGAKNFFDEIAKWLK